MNSPKDANTTKSIGVQEFIKGSATENVLFFKCHRKYYIGIATDNTNLFGISGNKISIMIF